MGPRIPCCLPSCAVRTGTMHCGAASAQQADPSCCRAPSRPGMPRPQHVAPAPCSVSYNTYHPAVTWSASFEQQPTLIKIVCRNVQSQQLCLHLRPNKHVSCNHTFLNSAWCSCVTGRRLWEDSKCSVRQLPAVGRQMGARLAAASLGSLQAIAACADAHRLEVAAQK